MENTKLLSGKLVIENDSLGYADITMNGITEKLTFSYLIDDKKFSMATKDGCFKLECSIFFRFFKP